MSTTETSTQDSELFDSQEYEVPFPKADDKEVTHLELRLSGNQKLNRHDPEHVALIESLKLGRVVSLNVSASVGGKAVDVKLGIDGTETVTHSVVLKLHEVVPKEDYRLLEPSERSDADVVPKNDFGV